MRSYVRVAFPSSPTSEVMVAKTAQPRNDLSPPKANGSGSIAMEVAGRRMWKRGSGWPLQATGKCSYLPEMRQAQELG